MKNISQIFLSAYLITAIVHIFSMISRYGIVEEISKILLMPLLLAYFISAGKGKGKLLMLPVLAILFSWFGDIALLTSFADKYFIPGLAAFLTAHILYIFTFKKYVNKELQIKWIPVLLFVLHAVFLCRLIYPGLGELMVPVFFYAAAITSMGIAAFGRSGSTTQYSFLFVSAGAICFIISDSLIAVNKFYSSFNQAGVLIMLTYIMAQYLIATGCIQHLWQSEKIDSLGSDNSGAQV